MPTRHPLPSKRAVCDVRGLAVLRLHVAHTVRSESLSRGDFVLQLMLWLLYPSRHVLHPGMLHWRNSLGGEKRHRQGLAFYGYFPSIEKFSLNRVNCAGWSGFLSSLGCTYPWPGPEGNEHV
jgi:hypothetical protein